MANSYFRFKQFTVNQDRCSMKVGTDGVLLGVWADCQKATRILDIGTGTGLISLMLAQRSSAKIDAIEIDPAAAKQATENIAASIWANRITVFTANFLDYTQSCSQKYDLIVSNPPYFQNSLKSPSAERNTARHTDELPFEILIDGSMQLLADKGHLAVILPFGEGEIFQKMAMGKGLFCTAKTAVIPRPNKAAKRLLLSFSLDEQNCQKSEILIETDEGRHCYSTQFLELTREFYLDK